MMTEINSRFVILNSVACDFRFFSGNAFLNTEVPELTKMAADLALKYSANLDLHRIRSGKLKISGDFGNQRLQGNELIRGFRRNSSAKTTEYISKFSNCNGTLFMPVMTSLCECSLSKVKLI